METYKQELMRYVDSIKDEKFLNYLLLLAKKFAEKKGQEGV